MMQFIFFSYPWKAVVQGIKSNERKSKVEEENVFLYMILLPMETCFIISIWRMAMTNLSIGLLEFPLSRASPKVNNLWYRFFQLTKIPNCPLFFRFNLPFLHLKLWDNHLLWNRNLLCG